MVAAAAAGRRSQQGPNLCPLLGAGRSPGSRSLCRSPLPVAQKEMRGGEPRRQRQRALPRVHLLIEPSACSTAIWLYFIPVLRSLGPSLRPVN